MQVKIRREDKVKINMSVVEELKRHQKEINHYLKGGNFRCNLHPKKDLYPCCSCSRFLLCKNNKPEREYILSNKSAYNSLKRRIRRDDKDAEKNSVLNSHEIVEKNYPCEPFDLGCPEKDNCNEGQKCPWHNKD